MGDGRWLMALMRSARALNVFANAASKVSQIRSRNGGRDGKYFAAAPQYQEAGTKKRTRLLDPTFQILNDYHTRRTCYPTSSQADCPASGIIGSIERLNHT